MAIRARVVQADRSEAVANRSLKITTMKQEKQENLDPQRDRLSSKNDQSQASGTRGSSGDSIRRGTTDIGSTGNATRRGDSGISTKRNVTGSDYDGQVSGS
jgi:hypothetical protein